MRSKLFIIIAILLSCSYNIKAQNNSPERKTEFHVNKIARELALTDSQRDEFTKIYSQFLAEFKSVNEKYPSLKPEGGVSLTDEQVKTNIESRFKAAREVLDVRENYYKKYLKFLTPQQIEKLYRIEKRHASRPGDKGPKDKGPGDKKNQPKKQKQKQGKQHPGKQRMNCY